MSTVNDALKVGVTIALVLTGMAMAAVPATGNAVAALSGGGTCGASTCTIDYDGIHSSAIPGVGGDGRLFSDFWNPAITCSWPDGQNLINCRTDGAGQTFPASECHWWLAQTILVTNDEARDYQERGDC